MLTDLVEDGEKLPAGYEFGPAAEWIRELLRRGHHVTVYTLAKDIDAALTFYGPNLTIRVAKWRAWGTGKDLFAAERAQLTAMMKEDRCDLIHAHWTYEFGSAALASGIPTLVTIHDLPWNVLRFFKDKFRVAKLLVAYGVAFRGKYFTAVSSDAANHFRRYFTPWRRITVIPNGLSQDVFEIARQTPEKKDRTRTVFATVLRGWSARKNGGVALQAFHLLRSRLPNVDLIMFGTDYGPGEAAELWARQNGLTEGVTFSGRLPYRTLLAEVNQKVDVLVHPSLDEAFSMAALEAMALKKPVIAGENTAGFREMLDGGRAGVLLDVTDPKALADAMERLAQDAAYREQLGTLGFQHVSSTYRIEAVFDAYEKKYREILATYV